MNRILILLASLLVVGNAYGATCDWSKASEHYQRHLNGTLDISNLTQQEMTCLVQVLNMTNSSSSRNKTLSYDGEEFTLRDVERKCEVYRYSDNYGDVECRGLRFIERKCEAYFSGEYETNGDIECRGSDLRLIERHCSVEMYSDAYGEISC